MAKISELVKTYRLLSDPNAPDWNIKFLGGFVVAFAIVAASGALLWQSAHADDAAFEAAPAAATSESDGGQAASCDTAAIDAEKARLGVDALPAGHPMLAGCP